MNLLQQRNEKAFAYLYDNYSAALYGVIHSIITDAETANDILQDVFLNIWKKMDSYDPSKGRLFTWMLNITRNSAIDTLRSKAHKMDQKIQDIGDDVHLYTGNLTVHPSVDHLGLSKVLEKLTKEQRIIIDLAYYKGCTQEEISKVLEIPLGTVKTRMRNAIIQLRNLLKLV